MPRALALLEAGELPVMRARALVEGTYGCSDSTCERIDAEVADRACRLTPSRVRDAAQKVLLREEADAVAARAAAATGARQVRRTPLQDDQAEIALVGPAVPLAQAFAALDADARALRAAGDGRGLDALRFDLATSRLRGDLPATGCAATAETCLPVCLLRARHRADWRHDPRSAPLARVPLSGSRLGPPRPPLQPPPDAGSPNWLTDRRCARPVRLDVQVPVTTALGLSDEPGWLDGHGWISAPTVRQLLPVAELRQVCTDARSGRLVDLAEQVVRPALDPAAVSAALLDMATHPFEITDTAWQTQPQHDPGDRLARVRRAPRPAVRRPDRRPGRRPPRPPRPRRAAPRRADRRLEPRRPRGRTHVLKHRGWTPVRTLSSTLWFSPAGQVVDVPFHTEPLDPVESAAHVPDPVALHALEAELLRPPTADDLPPDW